MARAPRKKKKAAAPSKAPGPKGTGAVKRTPLHIGDAAAVEDQEYEVETIVATGKQRGVASYLVKWKGWSEKHNTWEPLTHLVGAEELVREFNVEARRLDEESQLRMKKVSEDRAAAATAQKQAGQELLAARLAAAAAAQESTSNEDLELPKKKLRRAAIYKYYEPDPVDQTKMLCLLQGHDRCTQGIGANDGTSSLHNHLKLCHKEQWLEFDLEEHPERYKVLAGIDDALLHGVFSATIADEMFALWVAQSDRPLTMPEKDPMLQKIIEYCLKSPPDTVYTCPSYSRVYAGLIRLEAQGVEVAHDFVLAQSPINQELFNNTKSSLINISQTWFLIL
jgi:hypothetical protein